MKKLSLKFPLYLYAVFFIFIIFLYFGRIASDRILSMGLDRFELYNIDESLHYCYAQSALYHPIALINPFAKSGFTASCVLFMKVLSENILSLRIMNSVYSAGVLILMIRIGSVLKLLKKTILLSIVLTASFPLFFLGSISVLTEMMFSFFLLLSVFLMYKEKYLLSCLSVSLLPLVSQHGLIYLFVWAACLASRKHIRLVPVMFIPIILWTASNMILLGHPALYTVYYRPFLMLHPPADSLVTPREFMNFYFLLLSPLLILFAAMFAQKRRFESNKARFIQIIMLFQSLQLILEIFVIPFFYSYSFVYKIRQFIPVVPLAAILASFLLERAVLKKVSSGLQNLVCVSVAALSIAYLPYSVNNLQKFASIKNEILSREQEEEVMRAGVWLNDYIREKGITAVLGAGDDIPSPVTRRIWMDMPGEVIYYGTDRLRNLPYTAFNALTYKDSPIVSHDYCLFLIRGHDDEPVASELSLIKSFPSILLRFYVK